VNGDVASATRLVVNGVTESSEVRSDRIQSGGYLQQIGTGGTAPVLDGTIITYNTFINPGSTGVPANYQGVWDINTQYSVGQSVSTVLDTAPFYTVLQPPNFVDVVPYPPGSYVTGVPPYTTVVHFAAGGDPLFISEYSGSASYSVGSVVYFESFYYASITGINTAPPSADWKLYDIFWNETSAYLPGNIVVYNNQTFQCLSDVTGGNPPVANSTNWLTLIPSWSAATSYTVGQYVTYLNVLYQRNTPGVSAIAPPNDPTNWTAVVLNLAGGNWSAPTNYSTGIDPVSNPILWKSSTANILAVSEFVTSSVGSGPNQGLGTGFGWIAQGSVGIPRVLGTLTDAGMAVPALLVSDQSYDAFQPTIGIQELIPGIPESTSIIFNNNITPDSYIFLQAAGCRGPLNVTYTTYGKALVFSPNYIVAEFPIPDVGPFWYWIINPNPVPRGFPPPPPPPAQRQPTYEEVEALRLEIMKRI